MTWPWWGMGAPLPETAGWVSWGFLFGAGGRGGKVDVAFEMAGRTRGCGAVEDRGGLHRGGGRESPVPVTV